MQTVIMGKGDIVELLQEGRAIHRSLSGLRRDVKDDVMITRKFSQLMMEGRIRPALQLLSRETRSGPSSLDGVVSDRSGRTVRNILDDKHPALNLHTLTPF